MIKFVQNHIIEDIIFNSREGKNTKFLKASHSLWTRFKNYQKHPPAVYYDDDTPVAVIFATCSTKTKYINLYEIVTLQGHERKGYASLIWSDFIAHWHNNGMKRIKLSCTPDSIGFHVKNGLVFWSVDTQGSLRSDQPLMPTVSEQILLRNRALENSHLVMPDPEVCSKLKTENIEFLEISQKKLIATYEAIKFVDRYWLRNELYA